MLPNTPRGLRDAAWTNRRLFVAVLVAIVLMITSTARAPAAGVKDSESASHDDEAAAYQLVKTYEHPGFKVLQFNLAVLSHYSYMLISGKDCLLVDPGRDIDLYLSTARKEGVTIKGVYLTHSHADFVAGHLEVVRAAKCPVLRHPPPGMHQCRGH